MVRKGEIPSIQPTTIARVDPTDGGRRRDVVAAPLVFEVRAVAVVQTAPTKIQWRGVKTRRQTKGPLPKALFNGNAIDGPCISLPGAQIASKVNRCRSPRIIMQSEVVNAKSTHRRSIPSWMSVVQLNIEAHG